MASSNAAAVSAFIEGAPPGELADVMTDIKKLTVKEPTLLESATPAFEKYNEEQLTTVRLPRGSDKDVLVSSYNSLGGGRYCDIQSESSFAFDHVTQKASDVQPYTLESQHKELISSLYISLTVHAREHYPSSTHAVFPTDSDSALAILLVANKYSPSNFWNGRWRSTYLYSPANGHLSGHIKVDVHYYEDGNVRLTTSKPISALPITSQSTLAAATEITKTIATVEKKYQEELNRGFNTLSEGEFKGLRRQLPVTRQKVEWEKIGSYRAAQDIGSGRAR